MRRNQTKVYIYPFSITHLQPAGYANSQNHTVEQISSLTESVMQLLSISSLFLVCICNFIAIVILGTEVKLKYD